MITILYFGVLKQRLGVAQEQVAWGGGTGRELLHLLQRRVGRSLGRRQDFPAGGR